MPVRDEHERREHRVHGEVQPWHQVPVEDHEGEAHDGDADHRGQQCPREPGPHAQAGLALVQAVEVVDDQLDRRRDGEADEVPGQRVGVPVETESETDVADHHHQQVETDRVEDHQESEPAIPHEPERATRP